MLATVGEVAAADLLGAGAQGGGDDCGVHDAPRVTDETTNWDELTPVEKLESSRGRYLIATAFHYAVQQISRFPEERRADRDCEDMRTILNR